MTPDQVTEYINAIGKGLDPLIQKAGHAGTTVFAWAMKSNVITGILDLTVPWVFVLLSFIAAYICYLRGKKYNSTEWDEASAFLMFTGIAGVVIAAVFFCFGIQRLCAPEWSTMHDILRQVTPR